MGAKPGLERFLWAIVVGATAAMAGYVGLRGDGVSALLAALATAGFAGAEAFWLAPRFPGDLDDIRRSRLPYAVTRLPRAALAFLQTARLPTSMLDPSASGYSVQPDGPWHVHPCCLSPLHRSRPIGHGRGHDPAMTP